MARKNNLQRVQTIINGDMSGNLTSLITCIQYLDNISLQLNFTGVPVGTFQVLGSNDHYEVNNQVEIPGTFIPITLSPAPVAAGAAGNILMNLNQLGFAYIMLTYTYTSGSGILNAFINGKEI